MVRYGKGDVVGVDLLQPPGWLVQAGGNLEGLGFVLLQQFAQENQGQARIQDVFHQDNVSTPDRGVQILDQSYRTAGLDPLVAGDGHEVERGLDRDTSCQVGEKNGGALQHPYQQDGFSSKVVANLRTDFRHPDGNLLATKQHVVLVLSHGLCHSSTDSCQEKAPGYTVRQTPACTPSFTSDTFPSALLASACGWLRYVPAGRFIKIFNATGSTP